MAGNSVSMTPEAELEASRKKELLEIDPPFHYDFVVYNDPIHGTIELHPLLHKVINTPEFNRLKNIKQLGGKYYVYPGATHSRFEHSIGVCYIAGEFVRMLQKNQPDLKITHKEVLCVEMAGLCHDLGHGPFSHMFEKTVMHKKQVGRWCTKPVTEDDKHSKWEHEKLSKKIFERIYNKQLKSFDCYGFTPDDVEFIKEMIQYDDITKVSRYTPRKFLYEIVANEETGVDVDKWDYFERDCHHIGISNAFNWRRCMKLSRVIHQSICFRDKEISNIYDMFRTRSYLHTHAYQHKTVIAVEHTMSEAIRLAGDSGAKLLYVNGLNGDSKSIKEVVSDARDKDQLDGYLALTDSILQLIINANPSTVTTEPERKQLEKAQRLLRNLEKREIFHHIHTEQWKNLCISEDEEEATEQLKKATKEEVFLRKVLISYGTKNPVDKVHFYSKHKPNEFTTPEVSELIIPIAFEEKQLRVYWLKEEKATEKTEAEREEAVIRKFKELFLKPTQET